MVHQLRVAVPVNISRRNTENDMFACKVDAVLMSELGLLALR